jgi:hypothetical protein
MEGFQVKLGWKKSKDDHRDLKYNLPQMKINLPSKCDLRHKIRQIFQQFYNDCVANGTSNLITALDEDKYLDYTPSRLFIYYNARLLEGYNAELLDEGTTIRDAMKCLTKYNFIDERIYDYNERHVLQPPSQEIYYKAKCNLIFL